MKIVAGTMLVNTFITALIIPSSIFINFIQKFIILAILSITINYETIVLAKQGRAWLPNIWFCIISIIVTSFVLLPQTLLQFGINLVVLSLYSVITNYMIIGSALLYLRD